MLQEAKGTNGKILGSLNYFTKLNEKLPDKSLMKDKTKGTYFDTLGKGSASTIKKLFSIPAVGAKIKQFLQNAVNTISNDIDLAAKTGCYATYENRKKIRECLNQLKKCGFTVSNDAYNNIKKLRRLEDFHNKIISLDFRGEQYPIEVWLEWKGGKNILHILVKVIFFGDGKNDIYNTDQLEDIVSKKQLVFNGFEKWSGNYKVFNSAEEGKQDLQVICKAKEQDYKNEDGTFQAKAQKNIVGLPVVLADNLEVGTSGTDTGTWSREVTGREMILYNRQPFDSNHDGIDDSKVTYTSEYYTNAAKHELGHALGIDDAYNYEGSDIIQYYSQYNDIKEDIAEKGAKWTDENNRVNMAMFNHGPVINNDIEMLILAWQNNKMQYFHLNSDGTEVSEALGR